MAIEAFAQQNCSIARTLSFLGERWTVLVLRELFLGSRRFDEIQDELGIATNVLSRRLSTLVDEGILERRRYSERPERFEYRLTDAGRDLQPVVLAILHWGDTHLDWKSGPPLEVVHTECGHPFHQVSTCSHCGGGLDTRTVRARPGPGANRRDRERAKRLEARRAA
jgi:DNA-binding HxlR family transcriptional regulator